jgi:hypothetical protein
MLQDAKARFSAVVRLSPSPCSEAKIVLDEA